jgi:hypothetical protein
MFELSLLVPPIQIPTALGSLLSSHSTAEFRLLNPVAWFNPPPPPPNKKKHGESVCWRILGKFSVAGGWGWVCSGADTHLGIFLQMCHISDNNIMVPYSVAHVN